MDTSVLLPKRFVQLTKALEKDDWVLERISGSHHIFTKPKRRCIPVAFHGGSVSRRYAIIVLRQAGLYGSGVDEVLLSTEDGTGSCNLEVKKAPGGGRAVQRLPSDLSEKEVASDQLNGRDQDAGRLGKSATNRGSKIETEKNRQKEAESLVLKREFELLQLERQAAHESKEHQRTALLEKIQRLVALGNYTDVIEMTSSFNAETVGSSSEVYDFQCDILFYRIMALSEYAFSEVAFNSEAQRSMLNEALRCTSQFLELSPDRRDHGRELARKLQERVVVQYLNGLRPIFMQYLSASFSNSLESRGRNAVAEISVRHVKVMKSLLSEYGTGQGAPSQDVFYDLMDKVVDGFQFVVSATESKNIPLAEAFSNSTLTSIELVNMSDACIRKMLIKFDFRDFKCARQLAGTLTVFAKGNKDGILAYDTAQKYIFAPACTRKSLKLLHGIGSHVLDLIPIYELAHQKFGWKRFAGVLAADEDPLPNTPSFEDVLDFMSQISEVFEDSKGSIEDLVVSNDTRTFIFDTLADPICLAHLVVTKVLFQKNSDVSRSFIRYLRDYKRQKVIDFDDHAMNESCDKFRKSKYDGLRLKVAKLLLALLRVVQLYDALLEIDSFAKGRILENDTFLYCRFNLLPMSVSKLVMLSSLLFGPENSTLSILRQCLVLRNDIDIADNYHVKDREGKLVGQSSLARGLASPEAVRAYGMWSFNLVFGVMSKPFLWRFVLGEEARRLRVIDTLCEAVLGSKQNNSVEGLALDTLSKLSLASGDISLSDVQELLLQILRNPANHEWCHTFNGPGDKKRWAKDRSRKYHKLIARLRKLFLDSGVEDCLGKRAASVEYLLSQLQDTTQKQIKVPTTLKKDIAQTRSQDKITEASEYIKQWTLEEVHGVWNSTINLELAAATACDFFRRATGGGFPAVRSIVDESWNLRESEAVRSGSFSPETMTALRDVKYVQSILDLNCASDNP